MNRLFKGLLACLMIFSLVGCSTKKEEEPEESTTVVNPMTEVASLDELNTECNTEIVKPGVMGITDEKFIAVNSDKDAKIAEYDFSINGKECSIRSANIIDEDISGWWPGGEPAFKDPKEGIEYCECDSAFLARWFNINGQFVFVMKRETPTDGNMDDFKNIAEEVATVNGSPSESAKAEYYASLCGDYQDSVSQRASMNIATNDGSALMVDITWGTSAEETTEWILTMRQSEDGLFYYDDCCKRILKGDDATVVYKDGEGYFSLTPEGKFVWNGAADEECKECTFEKVQ